jgi:hypothetical protein
MGAEGDLHALPNHSVDHPDAGHGTAVAVVIGIEDERAQRRILPAARRRHPSHDRLQQVGHAGPLLGGDRKNFLALGADQVHDLLGALLRLRARKIDLVEDRYDLQSRVHSKKEIAQRLGLNSLRGIHYQDGALAGCQ